MSVGGLFVFTNFPMFMQNIFHRRTLCILKLCIKNFNIIFFTMFTTLRVKHQHVTGLFQNQFNLFIHYKINSCDESFRLLSVITFIYFPVAETINQLILVREGKSLNILQSD